MRLAAVLLLTLLASCRSDRPSVEPAQPKRGPPEVVALRTGDYGTLVTISRGSEDGVREGDIVYVGRLPTWITIESVEAFRSEGLFTGMRFPPAVGDYVYPEVGSFEDEAVLLERVRERERWLKNTGPDVPEAAKAPWRADPTETTEARKTRLEQRIRELDFWLGHSRRIPYRVRRTNASPGKVLAVKEVDGRVIVSISVGRKDLVQENQVYHLRRGAAYVGNIRITRLEDDTAAGVFDAQYTGPAAPPKTGDVAYPDG